MIPEWMLATLKLLHIGALIFWIGPTLGAWWMLRSANHHFGEPGMVSQYLYYVFLDLLWVEHIAFALLLITGVLMAWFNQWFGQPWLTLKLILIGSIILPLEIMDIWLGHVRLPQLFHSRHPSRPYSAHEAALLHLYHVRLTRTAIFLMPIVVTVIIWLALTKPG